jgi:hypothetical protein
MEHEPRYGYDANGNPITEEYVAEVLAEAEAGYDPEQLRPVGRPSLAGIGGGHSPRVTFRVPDDLRARAEAAARARGCTVSQLAREALEQFLAS